jgi:hypothetical protein
MASTELYWLLGFLALAHQPHTNGTKRNHHRHQHEIPQHHSYAK